MMNRAKCNAVLLPIPCGEGNGVVVGITAHVADDPITRGAIDMHSVAAVTIKDDTINGEVLDVAKVDGKGRALTHRNVAYRRVCGRCAEG